MTESNKQNQEWQNCPVGTVCSFVSGLRRQKQVNKAKKYGAVSAVCLIILLGGWLWIMQSDESEKPWGHKLAGMYCSDVSECIDKLLAGQLDEAIVSTVRGHLDGCPHCVEAIEKKSETYRQQHGVDPKFKYQSEPVEARHPPFPQNDWLAIR